MPTRFSSPCADHALGNSPKYVPLKSYPHGLRQSARPHTVAVQLIIQLPAQTSPCWPAKPELLAFLYWRLDGRQLGEHQVASAPRPLSGTQAGEHLVGVGLQGYMTIALNSLLFLHECLAPQVFEAVLDQIDPQGLKASLRFLVRPEHIWRLRINLSC